MRVCTGSSLYSYCLLLLLLGISLPLVQSQEWPSTIMVGGLFPLTGSLAAGGVQREAAARVAVININNDPSLLPGINFLMNTYNTNTSQAQGLSATFAAMEEGALGLIGEASSSVSQIIAITGGVFNMTQISYSSTSSLLSNKFDYPYFSRMVPPDNKQGEALYSIVDYYKWDPFTAAISTADTYGVGGVDSFVRAGNISLLTYQQFYTGNKDIILQISQLKESKARVFLAFMLIADAQTVVLNALDFGLIGETYVWMCSDGCAQASIFTFNGVVNDTLRDAVRGMIGTVPQAGVGPLYEQFLDQWETLDPIEFPGAGVRTINTYAPHAYDCVYTYAHTFHQLFYNSSYTSLSELTVKVIVDTLRSVSFIGLTGDIEFEANGDRRAIYQILNLRNNDTTFSTIGIWNEIGDEAGLLFTAKTQFYNGTEIVPDLDVREPFDYWSCKEKKEKTDKTGKSVRLQKPGDNDPNNIADHYICDQYIDCDNMSDEGFDCTPSYIAVFIAFGIITGILILTLPIFAIVAIVFGFLVKRRRIRKSSPLFLLVLLFAAFVGYCSTFAWYGKPNLVACNFQPWLLGLSVELMISVLFAKSFRIWQIFKAPFQRRRIPDWQLMIVVAILMVPALIILIVWTIVSTPTAHLTEVDGEDHYVCDTGGFTGPPGGIVFFFIFVGYTGLVLLFGVFLAFVTRNVPDEFSESRLVGYSVYNLTFLGAVVIPVFFVIRNNNPVAAWIIRTLAILYGFTATIWLQFIPPTVMLIVKDRCKNPSLKMQDAANMTATNSSGA